MNDENDERTRLRWGVKADGVLIAAFVLKARAEDPGSTHPYARVREAIKA